jgi:2-C-methyl-D-erythritol 4-phosphate cytidylyltransferase
MKVAAVVPAAGKGRRINSRTDKPYIEICGKPIIAHTLIRLSKNKYLSEIIVAVDKKMIPTFRRNIIDRFRIKKIRIVHGGRERKDSVFNALKDVSSSVDYILIHDGVRPFVTDRLIAASLKAAERFGASVVSVPLKPTLKYVGKDGFIRHTPDRRDLWEAQTPQVFKKGLIEKAYARIGRKKINITDDSLLVELLGIRPKIVLGSYDNIKITTKEDLDLARILIKNPKHEIRNPNL